MQRRIWIGVGLVFLLALLLVGLRLYLGFKAVADIPFSPGDASSTLGERSEDEVEEDRIKIDEEEEERDEDPPDEPPPVTDPPFEPEEEPPQQENEDPQAVVEESTAEPVIHARSPTKFPDEMFDTVLMMGADATGYLADSIILVLFPEGGLAPAIVSIPRDLYLYNYCSEDFRRVNANLGGCPGYANGPELLALAIADFTGVEVDHFARVDFEGFVELVDGLGGIEICFDHPTFDRNAQLDIGEAQLDIGEKGCPIADGATSLAYARSRNARQLVDGEWQPAWSSDFTRQAHQRELLLGLAGSLRDSSRDDLLGTLQDLSHTFRLDVGWSVKKAVDWALRYRHLEPSQVAQLRIPVEDYRSPAGDQVLVPTRTFPEVLAEWWGPAAG